MTTLINLDLCTLIDIAVGWLIGFICTVCHLVAYQTVVDALSIGAGKLPLRTCGVVLLAVNLVRMITTVVFSIASVLIANAFEILTGELHGRAGLVLGVAEFALVSSIAAVIVMITNPSLQLS